MVSSTRAHVEPALRIDLEDVRAEEQLDTIVAQRCGDERGRIGVVSAEGCRLLIDQRDARAEAGERLAELAADGAGADDGEPRR